MHARLWYSWWQRTCDVRYIEPSTINIPAIEDAQAESGASSLPARIEGAQVYRDTGSISFVTVDVLEKVNDENVPKQKEDGRLNTETTQTESLGHFSEYTIVSSDFNENIVPK